MKAYLSRIVSCMAMLLLPTALAADVDTTYYRIEIIVFSHADGRPDGHEVNQLQDFSALTDPLIQARRAALPSADELHHGSDREVDIRPAPESSDDAASRQAQQAELDAVLELIDTLADLEEGTLMPELPVWPEPYLALDRLSPKMERALARLKDSTGHEVLSWQAWHQPLASGTAGERVRIHDDRPITADWLKMTPTGTIIAAGQQGRDIKHLAPTWHYRLDGGVQLRQRQFMHLESELHWRVRHEPSRWTTSLELDTETTAGYRVHRMNQSRTVRPGRLEYFDSSWLGMLVLIEPIAPLDGSDTVPDEAVNDMD